MFTMTLIEDGMRTGLIERPLAVATQTEAIVLAEEAVKRHIKRDDIVLVPTDDNDFYVVQIKKTPFLVTLKPI